MRRCLAPGCKSWVKSPGHWCCYKHRDREEAHREAHEIMRHREGFHREGTGDHPRCPLCRGREGRLF